MRTHVVVVVVGVVVAVVVGLKNFSRLSWVSPAYQVYLNLRCRSGSGSGRRCT